MIQEYDTPERVMEFIPKATRFVNLPSKMYLKRGGVLHGGKIAYESVGYLNPARTNVILIMPGISADAHVTSHRDDTSPGWWEKMVGPGKPIDTNLWHVICINPLGSCKGSTGPASINQATGMPYRLGFPELSIEDIADAAWHALRAIGFEHVACVIGTSMGGMSSLALLARHLDLTGNHINISSALYAQPFAIAMRSLQREAIRCDPLWNSGRYEQDSYPLQGMVLARKLGLVTYRSEQEWNSRFGRSLINSEPNTNKKPFQAQFEIERYLDHHAHRFVSNFDPNCFLYLSQSIDWFHLGESFDCTAQDALSQLRMHKALILGVNQDILFPIHQQRCIYDGIRKNNGNTTFLPIDSPIGHDAFLVEIDIFGRHISRFLSQMKC